MTRRILMSIFLGGALILLAQPSLAQGRRPLRGPGKPAAARAIAEWRAGQKVVTGAPYSAVAVTERVQTLANGTRLTRKGTVTIYRDSAGRIRREQAANRVNTGGIEGEVAVPATIFISDPVAGVAYTLYPETKTGVKRKFSPSRGGQEGQGAWGPLAGRPGGPGGPGGTDGMGGMAENRRREDLGSRVIEGVEAKGQKLVATIPVDRIGNDQPIEIVDERWISPELKTLVQSRRSDPRLGENTYQLTKIDRAEPAASLFTLPEGYTITEAGRAAGGRSPGGARTPRPAGRAGRPW